MVKKLGRTREEVLYTDLKDEKITRNSFEGNIHHDCDDTAIGGTVTRLNMELYWTDEEWEKHRKKVLEKKLP